MLLPGDIMIINENSKPFLLIPPNELLKIALYYRKIDIDQDSLKILLLSDGFTNASQMSKLLKLSLDTVLDKLKELHKRGFIKLTLELTQALWYPSEMMPLFTQDIRKNSFKIDASPPFNVRYPIKFDIIILSKFLPKEVLFSSAFLLNYIDLESTKVWELYFHGENIGYIKYDELYDNYEVTINYDMLNHLRHEFGLPKRDFQQIVEFNRNILIEKINESKKKFDRAISKSKNPVILWFSGGKDSIVLLDLTKSFIEDYYVAYVISEFESKNQIDWSRKFLSNYVKEGKLFIIDRTKTFYRGLKILGIPSRQFLWCRRALKMPSKMFIKRIFADAEEIIHISATRKYEEISRLYLSEMITDALGDIELYPLLEWTDAHVWLYIHYRKLPIPPSYSLGLLRTVCLLCPGRIKPEILTLTSIFMKKELTKIAHKIISLTSKKDYNRDLGSSKDLILKIHREMITRIRPKYVFPNAIESNVTCVRVYFPNNDFTTIIEESELKTVLEGFMFPKVYSYENRMVFDWQDYITTQKITWSYILAIAMANCINCEFCSNAVEYLRIKVPSNMSRNSKTYKYTTNYILRMLVKMLIKNCPVLTILIKKI